MPEQPMTDAEREFLAAKQRAHLGGSATCYIEMGNKNCWMCDELAPLIAAAEWRALERALQEENDIRGGKILAEQVDAARRRYEEASR